MCLLQRHTSVNRHTQPTHPYLVTAQAEHVESGLSQQLLPLGTGQQPAQQSRYRERHTQMAGLRALSLVAAGGSVWVTAHMGPHIPREASHVWYRCKEQVWLEEISGMTPPRITTTTHTHTHTNSDCLDALEDVQDGGGSSAAMAATSCNDCCKSTTCWSCNLCLS